MAHFEADVIAAADTIEFFAHQSADLASRTVKSINASIRKLEYRHADRMRTIERANARATKQTERALSLVVSL